MTKRKDILLMTCLRSNARENLTRISKKTSIPVSTIFDRLREFEGDLIKKYTALPDFKKLGFDIRVNILVKIGRESRESFKEFVYTCENVNSLFRINNGFDFMVEAIFRNMDELQTFTDQFDRFHIEEKQEVFILEDIRREQFLSDATYIDTLFK